MEFSFIVPAYNETGYIANAIKSIKNLAGLAEFEIIVADNNSTDGTADFVKKNFPDVKVVNETKKGPAAARNAAAKTARGVFFVFLDADCRPPRDWLKKVKTEFEKEQGLVLVQGPYNFYGKISPLEKALFNFMNSEVYALIEFFGRKIFRIGGPGVGGNMAVRAEIFRKTRGFDESFEFYGEDVHFVKKAAKFGRVKFSRKLWVHSSARRLIKQGPLKTWWVYFFNGLASVFLGKSISKNKQ